MQNTSYLNNRATVDVYQTRQSYSLAWSIASLKMETAFPTSSSEHQQAYGVDAVALPEYLLAGVVYYGFKPVSLPGSDSWTTPESDHHR